MSVGSERSPLSSTGGRQEHGDGVHKLRGRVAWPHVPALPRACSVTFRKLHSLSVPVTPETVRITLVAASWVWAGEVS